MSKEIILVVETVSNEKGIEQEIIFEALEAALAAATQKRFGKDIEARVAIDRATGEYDTFRRWHVLDETQDDVEIENPEIQLTIAEAKERKADAEIGDIIEEPIESIAFGRIAAQMAKQVIMQKVREAERQQVVDQYQDKVGELVMGTVKRVDRGNVFLDLGGNADAIIPREEMIPRETMRMGDRVRGYLKEVRTETRGPQLVVSRIAPELIIQLFRLEVPEVDEGSLDIIAAARDPGSRAKVAVKGNDSRVDPIGACVGMRGSRVQSVSNELAGERVDIIPWDENPVQFVINSMAPAEVQSIVVDEDKHSMDIAVAEDQLAQAIGRGGQNITLASKLTGWVLNVMTEEEADEKAVAETDRIQQMFIEQLDIDASVAEILVAEGFVGIDEIAYVPEQELLDIEGFDAELVEELRNRSQDAMLTRAIADEESLDSQLVGDLLDVEGVDFDLAKQMVSHDIKNKDDLAEQSVDELMELEGMDESRAGKLIMAAREFWFADGDDEDGEEVNDTAKAV